VGGNLTVNGTTTTVNSTTLDITDLNINIAKDAASSAAANGAGFTIGSYGSSPTLLYVDSSNRFVLNRSVEATSFVGPLTGAVTGNVTGNVTGSSGSCTGNAATITSQANSATITAASTNTANQIVLRDASGNFSAGTITATLSGNASTSSSCSGNAATVSSISGNTVSSGQITAGLGFTPYNATNPSGYISGINSGNVTTALGFTPYNSTNPNGYTANTGTVTSVSGSGNVSGITLTGSITGSGTLTLGGSIGTLNQNTTGSSGSCTGNAATATNVAYSGLTGTVPTWNQNTTGTASNITAYTINQSVGTGNSPTFASVTAGSYNATSSLRYKDNVVTLVGASDLVKQLRGVSYDRKDGTVKNDVGVIAEEVQQLIPAIVGLNSEGMANSVDYGRLSAVLIEAVKDILARLEKLESK
jgi:hypothetical protein